MSTYVYIVTNFQKQRKPSSCFLQSVKIICTDYSRCCVVLHFLFVLSGRELKEVEIFFLLFFVRRTYITRLTNIWIFVQSLIWMLKSINSWMARHGGKICQVVYFALNKTSFQIMFWNNFTNHIFTLNFDFKRCITKFHILIVDGGHNWLFHQLYG